MPGVLNSNSHSGISREVGKMAVTMDPDLMSVSFGVHNEEEDIFDSLFGSSCNFLLDSADSDCDLPDNEHTVDLIKFMDSEEHEMQHKHHRIKCEDGCNICTVSPGKYHRYRVSERKDPFMGLVSEHCDETVRPSTSASVISLGQLSPVNFDTESDEFMRQKMRDSKTFVAWNTPKLEDETDLLLSKGSDSKTFVAWNTLKQEDETDLLLSKGSVGWQVLFEDEEVSVMSFPETPSPSNQSGTISGDDSDVDIETVTETPPRSTDSCGSSPVLGRRSTSPDNICKIESVVSMSDNHTSSSMLGFHSTRLSMSSRKMSLMSSAENIVATRSHMFGHKKRQKDKKLSKSQTLPAYTHVLCNSNSVNFHDYAMSPGACVYTSSQSTETGRPTVLSKRVYKRQLPVDVSDKEKQHHHNQLERNRRQKLADLFIDLRDEVPRIASQAKASKVLILNEATLFIRDLQRRERQQEDEISRELRKKEILQNQLRHLRAQMSGSCSK